jgi:coenzyme F420-reducing hydrogenase delta subunit/Pyruvate/2-oxoacid:ferredoxin oxidoreductase delta subunit
VAAGCEKEKFEQPLRAALQAAGINAGLWRPVNIFRQAAPKDGKAAAANIRAVLIAAVNRIKLARPVQVTWKKARQDVVVAGGGLAGMQAAVTLAGLGHRVVLVHGGEECGGSAAELPETFGYLQDSAAKAEREVRQQLAGLVRQVRENRKITVYAKSLLKSVRGELGDLDVVLANAGGEWRVPAGAVVLAIGSGCGSALEKMNGDRLPGLTDVPGVLAMIRERRVPKRIALIMDLVGEQNRAVSAQVLSAAELLAGGFGARVKLYCRQVRVAATGLEGLYRRARNSGMAVAKFREKPLLSGQGAKVVVTSLAPELPAEIQEEFDRVVIADRLSPGNRRKNPPQVAGLRPGPEGAIQSDNVWLLPALTNRPGILAAGAARGNSEFREALADGMAAAMRAHELLAGGKIETRDDAAAVDAEKCVLCLTCLRICPHGAISIDRAQQAAVVSAIACRRCGICAAECPARAIHLPGFRDEEIAAEIGDRPRLTAFVCENSAEPAANAAARSGYRAGAAVQLVRVPCAGKVDPRSVLTALEKGAEKVLILGCHPENCRYLSGATRAGGRAKRLAALLAKAGVDAARVVYGGMAAVEPARFAEYITMQSPKEQQHGSQDN